MIYQDIRLALSVVSLPEITTAAATCCRCGPGGVAKLGSAVFRFATW